MRKLAVGFTVAALALPGAAGLADAPAGAADDGPLQVAGRAAHDLTFEGLLRIRWTDGAGERNEIMSVQGGGGSVVVRGGSAAMASLQQRLVEHAGVWNLLWPAGDVGSPRPSADAKYQLVHLAPTTVSDRSADVVEVRQGGVVLERLALDQASGLLLRREQFDGDLERPTRTIEFEVVRIGGTSPAPDAPRAVVNASPEVMAAGHVPSGVSAPASLAGGYRRIGVYRRSGVTQVLYSDGLYDLSVFEQPGRLDRRRIPAGTSVEVGGSHGLRYGWPGGEVMVWGRSGAVYTAVSDAPTSQLVAAVRSLPAVAESLSLLRRLRQACRSLIQPLA